MKIISHLYETNDKNAQGVTDHLGYSVDIKETRSPTFPDAVIELHTHTRLSANRPGVDAWAPLTAVEALALAEMLRFKAIAVLTANR